MLRVRSRIGTILLPNALVTLSEVLVGFALALVAGIGLGIAVFRSPTLERVLYPLIIASQTVPIPALAPLLLVWFGPNILPKVSSPRWSGSSPSSSAPSKGCARPTATWSICCAPSARRRGRVFRLAEFPSSLPSIFAGARIAVAICVIGAVFGELVGARAGLGYLMTRAIAQFETPRLVAAIVLLSVMGTGLFALVGLVERPCSPGATYDDWSTARRFASPRAARRFRRQAAGSAPCANPASSIIRPSVSASGNTAAEAGR